jgi:hypothetical protein
LCYPSKNKEDTRCIQNQIEKCEKKEIVYSYEAIFLEFLKASIADLITLLLLSLQNSEGGGNSNSDDSCADPCQFLPFLKTKI